jgi:hypothetical protein
MKISKTKDGSIKLEGNEKEMFLFVELVKIIREKGLRPDPQKVVDISMYNIKIKE